MKSGVQNMHVLHALKKYSFSILLHMKRRILDNISIQTCIALRFAIHRSLRLNWDWF